jgi:hypothetical protein
VGLEWPECACQEPNGKGSGFRVSAPIGPVWRPIKSALTANEPVGDCSLKANSVQEISQSQPALIARWLTRFASSLNLLTWNGLALHCERGISAMLAEGLHCSLLSLSL